MFILSKILGAQKIIALSKMALMVFMLFVTPEKHMSKKAMVNQQEVS